MSESKKGGKTLLFILAILVLLAVAGFLLVTFGNPQWDSRLYVHQAKNAPGNQLDPKPGYSGSWNNWDQNGRLKSTFHYRNGLKDGPYLIFTTAGEQLSDGQYSDGDLDGLQKIRMEDGSRTEIPYEKGKRNGVERSWYPTGEVAVEAPFVDGLQEGSVSYYYETGSVHSSIPFYKGKREGVHKTFYPNGAPQGDESYRDDQLNGRSEFWSPDGLHEMVLNYRDGRLDGLQAWFHPNGKKAREARMSMGEPDGEWREWDEDGTKTVDEEYELGELKKPKEEAKPETEKKPDTDGDKPGMDGDKPGTAKPEEKPAPKPAETEKAGEAPADSADRK